MSTNATRPRPLNAYWRVQYAGDPTSRTWRSEIWDGSGHEAGTSCCDSLDELVRWAHAAGCAPVGALEIVVLRGRRLGTGYDGESVVEVVEETARWHHPDWSWTGEQFLDLEDAIDDGASVEAAMVALGWAVAPARPVEA